MIHVTFVHESRYVVLRVTLRGFMSRAAWFRESRNVFSELCYGFSCVKLGRFAGHVAIRRTNGGKLEPPGLVMTS